MTDYSKLTDKQINEAVYKTSPKSKRGITYSDRYDFCGSYEFCLRVVEENSLYIQPRYSKHENWEVTKYYKDSLGLTAKHMGIHGAMLTRAILECYLKMKEINNE